MLYHTIRSLIDVAERVHLPTMLCKPQRCPCNLNRTPVFPNLTYTQTTAHFHMSHPRTYITTSALPPIISPIFSPPTHPHKQATNHNTPITKHPRTLAQPYQLQAMFMCNLEISPHAVAWQGCTSGPRLCATSAIGDISMPIEKLGLARQTSLLLP